jgi:Pregnancy-associated plasma protein-A
MRPIKVLASVVLGLALCAGTAQASAPSSICDPVGSGSFLSDSLAGAGSAAGRGAVREPDLGQDHTDLPKSAKGVADATFGATVPVYFHVVTDGKIGSLTNAQIDRQIRVLNDTFAGAEGGADSGFTFVLAGVTRTDNADWFYGVGGLGGGEEHDMKAALHQGGPDALNLYSTTAGELYLGWAYLPEITTKPGQEYIDGVVFDWETMPGTSTKYAGQFDQGETVVHEVGHWLNLEHTFYRGCSSGGDYVADTPPEKTSTDGCPAGKDTCSAPGLDPIHNYMDYSYDSCYTEFTPGQVQRMRDAWLFYRAPG